MKTYQHNLTVYDQNMTGEIGGRQWIRPGILELTGRLLLREIPENNIQFVTSRPHKIVGSNYLSIPNLKDDTRRRWN